VRDQSRLHSLLETLASIAIGFVVSLGITAVVLPAYGMPVSWQSNVQITAIFTVASILRGYAVRRVFVWAGRRYG
jgi:putative flippase GtrA